MLLSVVALAARQGGAQSSVGNSCVANVTAVSATTVTLEAPFALNGLVPNANTKNCSIEYSLGTPEYNETPMVKSATSFSVPIHALPPSTSISFRLVCDGTTGPLLNTATSARVGPPPRRPVVIAATRVGEKITFEFVSDPSEPTVYWAEFGTPGHWMVFPDQEGTFDKRKMGVVTAVHDPPAKISFRLGIRNSSGIVYSHTVP
jgi:hypothetical protein